MGNLLYVIAVILVIAWAIGFWDIMPVVLFTFSLSLPLWPFYSK